MLWLIAAFSAMFGDEAALAHRRAGGDHDEVARLEPAGHAVEIGEAGRRAGQLLAGDGQLVQLVELVVEQRGDRAEVAAVVRVGDVEHDPLGLLDDLARALTLVEDARLDLIRRVEQAPQQRGVADDARVLAQVGDVRDRPGEEIDAVGPAGGGERSGGAQGVGHGDRVDRLAALVEVEHRGEDGAVALAIEVLGPQRLLDHERVHRALRHQDRPEHRLLCLDVVRRRERLGDGELGRALRDAGGGAHGERC